MTRILMVCLGNICRSPLAEGILKSKLPEHSYHVDSAGTGSYHLGSLPDIRSIAVAIQHGIDITDQRARQFSASDFDNYDHIYVMDNSNFQDVIKMARNVEDMNKVELILDILNDDHLINVPDPYHDDDGFRDVFQMLEKACDMIAENRISK